MESQSSDRREAELGQRILAGWQRLLDAVPPGADELRGWLVRRRCPSSGSTSRAGFATRSRTPGTPTLTGSHARSRWWLPPSGNWPPHAATQSRRRTCPGRRPHQMTLATRRPSAPTGRPPTPAAPTPPSTSACGFRSKSGCTRPSRPIGRPPTPAAPTPPSTLGSCFSNRRGCRRLSVSTGGPSTAAAPRPPSTLGCCLRTRGGRRRPSVPFGRPPRRRR
jgi:hypothetical protein